MKYRNTRTGAVIDIPSELHGECWEPVEVPGTSAVAEETTAPEVKTAAKKPRKTVKK